MSVNLDPLNLPGLKTESRTDNGDHFAFRVSVIEPSMPRCCLLQSLRRNGTKEQRFRDFPMHGKFVDVVIDRQRFQCRECKATVYEDVPHLAEGRRMTERLLAEVVRRGGPETFAKVAAEYGLSEGTIRSVFHERISARLSAYQMVLPRVLGIDEKHIGGAYRTVIGNVEEKTLLDLLPDRKMKTLDAFFASLPDRDNVEVWCQDMWPTYRKIAQKHFPKARIVIDRFHVVSLATVAMESVRRRVTKQQEKGPRLSLKRGRGILLGRMPPVGSPERETLDEWFARWPILREAFEAKEMIVSLYSCSDSQSAQQWYAAWQAQLSPALTRDFRPVVTAFRNWNSEIMAYFDHPQTNAYLESVNSLIAALDRNGRGYAFETIRAKALLSYGIHKASKPKFQRRPTGATAEMIIGLDLDRPVNLGVDIDLLTAAISTPGALSGSKMLKRPINH